MAPIEGERTLPNAVPTGELRYQGTAFTATARGTFNYTIGANRYGSGRITGLSGSKGDLTLDSAQMKGSSFSGFVTYGESDSGSYRLELFGPKAEEIAGHAFHPDYHKNPDNSISLSGTRQEKP